MARYIVSGMALTLALLGFSAQTSTAQSPPQVPGSTSPASPPAPNAGTSNAPSSDVPLSKKLDESDGVIKPPHGIDPGMHKDPPAATGDKMPVIVPPGEPGGDQSVQPK